MIIFIICLKSDVREIYFSDVFLVHLFNRVFQDADFFDF